MKRLLAAAFVGVFAIGCETNVPAPESGNTNSIELLKADAPFDPAARLFLHHDNPVNATVLHEEFVQEFISKPGFGGGRMMVIPVRPNGYWAELTPDSSAERPFAMGQFNVANIPQPPLYDAIHETIKLPDGTVKAVKERFWKVAERKLVSTEKSAAYLIDSRERHEAMKATKAPKAASPTLPMAELTEMPTRPLDEFETEAVAKIREGHDVMLKVDDDEMRAFGAIRARSECISCHKVEVGTLLGAFTYTLTPINPETPDEEKLKDLKGLTQDEMSAVATIEANGGVVTRAPGGSIVSVMIRKGVYTKLENGQTVTHATPRPRARNRELNVLAVLPKLETLDLAGALVSDEGISEIAALKTLKKVDLRNTAVTTEGAAKLKKQLPNCEVLHQSTAPAAAP